MEKELINQADIIKSERSIGAEAIRVMHEVQGAITVAKKFPRDEVEAEINIKKSCKRLGLAEIAMYSYPRGGQNVTGPSIRLAEAIAQGWGNIDFGVRELEQVDGGSKIEAYCWDMEKNVRQTKIFIVPHQMKAKGMIKKVTDPRDIYELVANQAARRVRACILGVIPRDIIDSAIAQCEETLRTGYDDESLWGRVTKMVEAFQDLFVTKEMLETRLKHKIESTKAEELVSLKKIYASIRDGYSKKEEWFEVKGEEKVDELAKLNEKLLPPKI